MARADIVASWSIAVVVWGVAMPFLWVLAPAGQAASGLVFLFVMGGWPATSSRNLLWGSSTKMVAALASLALGREHEYW